ncbi:hypothetical protein B0H19DRAFT_519253 [Mycena capillaripes]|nr:hypothetical protein B0H19DRAFT_519253 [Mycena capillaripes]
MSPDLGDTYSGANGTRECEGPPLILSYLIDCASDTNEEAAKKIKPQTHFEHFFSGYPRFQYDPSAPVSAQYHAMCRKYGFKWSKSQQKSQRDLDAWAARAGFRLAMVRTFNDLFGTDVDDLGNWQAFCRVLDIDPIPQTLSKCQTAVRDSHVNLVDLVDWGMLGAQIHKFETERELAEYTKMTEKFFPKEEAEAGGLLRFLLRHILRPGAGNRIYGIKHSARHDRGSN